MQDENTKVISGTIPAGGIATIYVIKIFTADDITDGKVTNTANIAAGADTTGPEDTNAEVSTDAEETAPSAPDKTRWTPCWEITLSLWTAPTPTLVTPTPLTG